MKCGQGVVSVGVPFKATLGINGLMLLTTLFLPDGRDHCNAFLFAKVTIWLLTN